MPGTGSDPHVTMPDSSLASFRTVLQTFLREELADRYADMFESFVVSGGQHGLSSSLTGTTTSLQAYVSGFRINQPEARIPYLDNNWTFVIAHIDQSGDLPGGWIRVGTTHFLTKLDPVTSAYNNVIPVIPADSILLMRVTTAGGAITLVRDYRNLLGPVHDIPALVKGIRENGTDQAGYPLDYRRRGVRFSAFNGQGATIDGVAQAAPSEVPYAGVLGMIIEPGSASLVTKGALWFLTNDGGYYLPQMHLTDTGQLVLNSNSSTYGALSGLQSFLEVVIGDRADAQNFTAVNDIATPTDSVHDGNAISCRFRFVCRNVDLPFKGGAGGAGYIDLGSMVWQLEDKSLNSEQSRFVMNGRSPDYGGRQIFDLLSHNTGGVISRIKYKVVNKTGDYVLSAVDSIDTFTIFTNVGATDDIDFYLPRALTCHTGYAVSFYTTGAYRIGIRANANDRIGTGDQEAVGNILSALRGNAGGFVTLVCVREGTAGEWAITNMTGGKWYMNNHTRDSGMVIPFVWRGQLINTDSFILPTASFGHGSFIAADDSGGAASYMDFIVDSTGVVTKMSGTADTAAADVNATISVFSIGTQARVKNQLGTTRRILCTYVY